jgi:hypothetical protein
VLAPALTAQEEEQVGDGGLELATLALASKPVATDGLQWHRSAILLPVCDVLCMTLLRLRVSSSRPLASTIVMKQVCRIEHSLLSSSRWEFRNGVF